MNLGKNQLITLKYYLDCKGRNLSFYGWVLRCWKCYLFMVVYLGLLMGLDFYYGISDVFYGAVAGIFFRDIATYYKLRKNWPMLNEVLSWSKVEELLRKNKV